MRITTGPVRLAKPAMFVTAVAILLALASILLSVSVGFGFAADETMVNTNTGLEYKIRQEHAANFAFTLFAVVQIALMSLILTSGVLKTRCHVALRAVGALFAGVLVSFLLVTLMLRTGWLPSPLSEIDRAISAWIEGVI